MVGSGWAAQTASLSVEVNRSSLWQMAYKYPRRFPLLPALPGN